MIPEITPRRQRFAAPSWLPYAIKSRHFCRVYRGQYVISTGLSSPHRKLTEFSAPDSPPPWPRPPWPRPPWPCSGAPATPWNPGFSAF